VADAFGQLLLPVDRFKAGGVDSVRGFAQDSLGPVDPFTETAIGGEGVAVFNQELRFPLYRWFRSAVFFDAGNVYLTASDFDPLDLRYSAGVGIRFNFPFGLLRLDWARAFDRRPGEEASQLWFSFGHAF
jgi:outer membrane protein insertion porin family